MPTHVQRVLLNTCLWLACSLTHLPVCAAQDGAPPDGPALAGDWLTGPTRIEVVIHSWGDDCGMKPQSAHIPGGGKVRVRALGSHLIIDGQPTLRTDSCWSENPTVQRVASSQEGGTWQLQCRTPPNEPKAERGDYMLQAETLHRLIYREQSRYDWQLRQSTCSATITRTQRLTRPQQETAVPATSPPSASPSNPSYQPPRVRRASEPDRAPALDLSDLIARRIHAGGIVGSPADGAAESAAAGLDIPQPNAQVGRIAARTLQGDDELPMWPGAMAAMFALLLTAWLLRGRFRSRHPGPNT